MADPLSPLNPARAFPSEIEEMVRHVAAIRRDFLTNSPVVAPPMRSTIRESWQRCAALIEPGCSQVPIVIASDAELHELCLTNEPFLTAANAVVKRLAGFLSGSGYIIGLADAKGRMLQVNGDKATINLMERTGLIPGSDWSEATVGTNGIGTALAVGHAVTVIGPEHFCDGWQDITCITVPIRNPWGGDIAGLLDLSGDYHLVRPFFTGILTAAALEIKENLKYLLSPSREPVTPFHIVVPSMSGSASDGVIGKQLRQPIKSNPTLFPLKNDLQAQLDFQERRAFAAERLAIASGTVSASLDIEATLTQVAQQAAHLLSLNSSAVCLLDEQGAITLLRTWCKPPSHAPDLIKTVEILVEQSEVINQLYESGEPVAIDDVHASLQLPVQAIEEQGIHSLVLLPLIGAHNLHGFIVVTRPIPCHWQPDDIRLELTLAFHAATAIENARLFQTLQQHHRHVETINAINQLLHTLYDPTQQLGLIIEQVVNIMELDGGLILLDHGANNDSTLSAHSGLNESVFTDLYQLIKKSLTRGKSSLLCSLKCNENITTSQLKDMGLCDIIVAPLTAGCDVLGLLMVGSHQHRELSNEDLTLLTNIGQQLGMALKNAQLLRAAGEMQALREADRIKSRFLMMVSHDLRSPLTAIRTSVESLLDRYGDHSPDSQEQLLRNIAGQAKRLGGLVDQLLDLMRIEAGALPLDRDWTELGALIADTIAKFQRLNAACQINQNLTVDLPLVYIDPERMVQVLWNLLENAHKYSPPSTPITVEASSVGQEVFIRVADRGSGIPAGEHEKIFQYFYRLNREQQMHAPGSGLGLAICRGIIDAHGGRIWAEDRPGGGSIFSIALPPSLADTGDLIALENIDTLGYIRN